MKSSRAIIAILCCLAIACLILAAGSQGSLSVAGGIPLFALCGIIGFILHWAVFLPSYWFQTEHYFDLTGAVSFIAAISIACFFNPAPDVRTLLLCLLIALWALRLGRFLFVRVKKAGRDSRFDSIKTRFWRFALTWTLGGLWVLLTMAAPLAAITATSKSPLGLLAYVGLLCWIVGFSLEVAADHQKSAFRSKPENARQFITSGLWAWSRHPNYFGEILLWIGLALMAFPVLRGWQLATMISPVFVALLLTRVSGVPPLEHSAEEKWGHDPDYQAYKRRTPVLIPRPPSIGNK